MSNELNVNSSDPQVKAESAHEQINEGARKRLRIGEMLMKGQEA